MLLFFDTEFTDLHNDAKLISIGLVSEDGRTFYAELSDTYQVEDCSEFVRASVLPLLEGGNARMTLHRLTLQLGHWIKGFNEPVTLATDSLAWDWPWIQHIFRSAGTWPRNLHSQPTPLYFKLEFAEIFNRAVNEAFAKRLRRHHALDDAKANRLGWIAADGQLDGLIPNEATFAGGLAATLNL